MNFIRFRVASKEYAIDIAQVTEVIRMCEITPIPNAARFVRGVIRLRGRVIPLISLRERFGMADERTVPSSQILIGEIDGSIIGLIVDDVEGVVRIEENQIEAPRQVMKDANYLSGVGKVEGGLILVVDLERLLNRKEKGDIPALEEELGSKAT